MNSISEALGASAAPHELELNGRVVHLTMPTQRVKSELERWLYQKHIKSVQEAKELIEPGEYTAMLNEAIKRHGAGEFSWGGQALATALRAPLAMSKLMSLISIDPATKAPVSFDEFQKAFSDEGQVELLVASMAAVVEESKATAKKKATSPSQSE